MGKFLDAMRSIARRFLMPTTMSSRQLEGLDQQVRDQAVFSARVWQTSLLGKLQQKIIDLVTGESPGPGQYTTPATVRLALKEELAAIDYVPEEGTAGTIQDLRTDARLNLIIRTQEQMATGHGQRIQSMDPDTIDEWPAQQLLRIEDRKEKRTWTQRWRGAGGQIYPGSPGGLPLEPGFSEGRLVARKDDPIWTAISRFGKPHPPFDYNSGVGVEDVDRDTCDELGITSRGETITAPAEPPPLPLPTAEMTGVPPQFRAVLERDGYKFDGDTVTA